MSKTTSILLVLLALVIGVCVVYFAKSNKTPKETLTEMDQVFEKSTKNPTFTSWEQVEQYQTKEAEEYNKYLAFLAIEKSILKDVTYVCLNRKGSTTLQEIVDEYASNHEVYDNLPKGNVPPDETGDTTLEATPVNPSTPPIGTVSYSQRDTTIPMKAKVRVREEVVYE